MQHVSVSEAAAAYQARIRQIDAEAAASAAAIVGVEARFIYTMIGVIPHATSAHFSGAITEAVLGMPSVTGALAAKLRQSAADVLPQLSPFVRPYATHKTFSLTHEPYEIHSCNYDDVAIVCATDKVVDARAAFAFLEAVFTRFRAASASRTFDSEASRSEVARLQPWLRAEMRQLSLDAEQWTGAEVRRIERDAHLSKQAAGALLPALPAWVNDPMLRQLRAAAAAMRIQPKKARGRWCC